MLRCETLHMAYEGERADVVQCFRLRRIGSSHRNRSDAKPLDNVISKLAESFGARDRALATAHRAMTELDVTHKPNAIAVLALVRTIRSHSESLVV